MAANTVRTLTNLCLHKTLQQTTSLLLFDCAMVLAIIVIDLLRSNFSSTKFMHY